MVITKRKQRGDLLIDALVGLLIASFIGLGIEVGISTTIGFDVKNRFQSDAVYQLNNLLETKGDAICGTSPAITLSNNVSLPVQVSCKSVNVSISNAFPVSSSVNEITLTVNSLQYFGSPGQIKVSG